MRTERVVITGGSGQLGKALTQILERTADVTPLSSAALDITNWSSVRDTLGALRPTLVINCAAATDVDRCEREPTWAYQVNAIGTRNVAWATRAVAARLIHISTNYVFDGNQESAYHEYDTPNPISVYGASKLAGEREVQSAISGHIVRTAWLYGKGGRNFVSTMRRLMTERKAIDVVNDQYGNPTSVDDLAITILSILGNAPPGVYHAVNEGIASWYEWALAVRDGIRSSTTVGPIPASQYRRDATPPTNGALTSLVLPKLGISQPHWRDALERSLAP